MLTFLSVASAERKNILSSQTIGEDEPCPASLTFHLMFLVSLHVTGGSPFRATPVA